MEFPSFCHRRIDRPIYNVNRWLEVHMKPDQRIVYHVLRNGRAEDSVRYLGAKQKLH
jgi:hypothetical protein